MDQIGLLHRWGTIAVEGPDAAQFLHAQLTNDIVNLQANQVRLAGLCTAKGRLLGTFFAVRQSETVLLFTRADVLPALVKRLSMFVLRSKCKARDASGEFSLEFCRESAAESGLQPMGATWSEDGSVVMYLRPQSTGSVPVIRARKAAANAAAQGPEADDAFEQALNELGLAYVSQPTVELFVPQAVNWDLVGGVSFSKGCYPGQEVVARSHYLGKVKRRSLRAQAPSAVPAGADVWLVGKDNEPVGQVVTAVFAGGQSELLVELPLDEATASEARFEVRGEQASVPLTVLGMHYDVQAKGNLFEGQ